MADEPTDERHRTGLERPPPELADGVFVMGCRGSRWMVRIAVVCYLAIGIFPYLASGLLVPPLALAALMACWAGGLVATLRWASRRPIVAPAAVAAAIGFWFTFVSVGSAVFHWTA